MKTPIETERKFLIRMPDINALAALNGVDLSDIEQTYLVNPDGLTERVRKRVYKNKTVYTHTTKKRVSKLSSEEYESVLVITRLSGSFCSSACLSIKIRSNA